MAKDDLVKVVAKYPSKDEKVTLWGIDFVLDGDDYVANVTAEQAESLLDAERVTKSKAK